MAEFSPSDPEQVEERAKAARVQSREIKAMLAEILGRHEGRAWFWQVLSSCGVFAAERPNNALHLAFAEGQRNVGLRLMADAMEASPNFYVVMLQENQNA